MNHGRTFCGSSPKHPFRPTPISKYVHSIADLRPGDRVVLFACVSWRDRRANLADQIASLRQQVEARNAVVVGTHRYIGQRYRPKWIRKAVHKLDRRQADWLLAETSDRFARTRLYDCKKNPDAQAEPHLFRALQRLSNDRLMTHLNPDATNSETRSYQRRRGQHFKGNCGGRPKKFRYEPRYSELPNTVARVKRLRRQGMSWRQIGALVGRSPSTIRGWLKRQTPT